MIRKHYHENTFDFSAFVLLICIPAALIFGYYKLYRWGAEWRDSIRAECDKKWKEGYEAGKETGYEEARVVFKDKINKED